MMSFKTPLVFVSTLIVGTLLLSWTLFDGHESTAMASSSLAYKDQLRDAETYVSDKDNGPSAQRDQPPAAEDVLVQKLPKDDKHLLVMAYYSKENYSGSSVTIDNGYKMTLRDDGKGDDKVAGDGLYTAKIAADVNAFRNDAINISQQMNEGGYKPVTYDNRQQIIDPDTYEGFDVVNFDACKPVSISGITNALSADDFKHGKGHKLLPANRTSIGTSAPFTALNATAALATTPTTLDSIKQNCLVITNLGVVEDSTRTWNYCTQKGNVNGPWTFGSLMRQLASTSPSQPASDSVLSNFIKTWLRNWEVAKVINGDSVKARALVDSIILNPWLSKSQQAAGKPTRTLDMRFAPFKLIAIVNRFDLRGQLTCGEGRLVFCLIDANCGGPLQFTVIFEYGINKPQTCDAQHAWAQQWVNLKNFPLGSRAYNQALQNITDQFTKCGTNPSKANQSSLDQLRTDEIALVLPAASVNPKRWELREFVLSNVTASFRQTEVKQNAADKYNVQVANADVQRMVAFVNQKQAKINAGTDTVPVSWQGLPFLGGATLVNGAATGQPPAAFHWDGTGSGNTATFITDDNARFNWSLQSCSGCHAGETQTAFTHINPAFFGKEARLSGFLTGKAGSGGAIDFDNDTSNGVMSVKDAALRPATNPAIRAFNDIDRRARDLQRFVNTACGSVLAVSTQLMFDSTIMVH